MTAEIESTHNLRSRTTDLEDVALRVRQAASVALILAHNTLRNEHENQHVLDMLFENLVECSDRLRQMHTQQAARVGGQQS